MSPTARISSLTPVCLAIILLNVGGVLPGGECLAQPSPEVRADFNGDGRGDLAIGVHREALGNIQDAGAVQVLYGSPSGLTATGSQFWSEDSTGVPGTSQADDNFGAALATGDFNGDGRSDLAVSVPGENIGSAADAGAIIVLYGSPDGLIPTGSQRWHQDSSGIPDVAEAADAFGGALAAGNFDGDDHDDLAIGVPGEDLAGISNAGTVQILYGSPSGLAATGVQVWQQDVTDVLDAAGDGDNFGRVLAAGDFDDNGRDDLAIGIPGEDAEGIHDAGAVAVIYGTGNGLAATNNQFWHQNSTDVLDAAEEFDHFGGALATGDFDGNGRADLAIGVEDEDVDGFVNGGAVNVLYGSNARLTATDNDFWHQNVTGIRDDTRKEDSFGDSLAAGDFDADGRDDLAVGVFTEDIEPRVASGLVHVIYGCPPALCSSGGGLSVFGNQDWHQNTPDIPDTAESSDFFGIAVATDDFNGDGRADLAIGVQEGFGSLVSVGAVHVLYGNEPVLSAAGNQFWHQNVSGIAGGQEQGDSFGGALANNSRSIALGGGLTGTWARLAQRCAKGDRRSGCKLQGALAITNPGIRTVERSVLRVFLSADETLDDTDTLLHEVTVRKIRAGHTHRQRLDVELAADAAGMFVIGVLDATNVVGELDEDNNFISAQIP